MTQVFHVVGEQGSGKSTLILMLAASYAARGVKCIGVDAEPALTDGDAERAAHPEADVIWLEHHPDDSFTVRPGDTIIRLEQVRAPGAA